MIPKLSAVLALLLFPLAAHAADHVDAPMASGDPAVDITDFYTWMTPDAERLVLVLNVAPYATENSRFRKDAVYAFHVHSSNAYGEPQTETQILCRFYQEDGTGVECWAGSEYISGNPNTEEGIQNDAGNLRVFAGLRDDPFFFEFNGFLRAKQTVTEAAPSLSFDDAGCPQLDEATANALVGMLQSGSNGEPASNSLANTNVLSLVVEIDKNLVNTGGDLLATWGAVYNHQ